MKKTTFLLASAALSLAATTQAAEVSTDPVGYITLTVNGTGGVGTEAFSYLTVPLLPEISSSGSITAEGANTITSDSAGWVVDSFNTLYYVQITSGDNVGVSSTITDNTADTLTTADDLSSLVAVGDTFTIRKCPTIGDVFGSDNSAGLKGAGSAASADTILIPNPQTQGFEIFYYKNSGLGSPGWFSTSSAGEKSDEPLYPGTGFLVRRVESSDLEVVVAGTVQTVAQAVTPIEENVNFIASHYPTDVTLNTLFGSDGGPLVGGSSAATADTVLIPNGSGGFTIYYYKSSGLGSPGWFSTSVAGEQGDAVIAQAGDLIIVNRSQSAAFNLEEAITF